MGNVREDAQGIISEAIQAVLPEAAVKKALQGRRFEGEVVLLAIGKAAWNMAQAAKEVLGDTLRQGLVITKYHHSRGEIPGFEIIEAGHPVPDAHSVEGARKALEMVQGLNPGGQVIFLISGGGSALFEMPMEGISLEDIMVVTEQLLKSGADIVEINTVRKRLSAVKGGKFAAACKDAAIFAVVLSDVLGDRLDSIASGPAYPDATTSEEALRIIDKYGIRIREDIRKVMAVETPKSVDNCETVVTGSVSELCHAAAEAAKSRGYHPLVLASTVDGEAREVGRFFASMAREIKSGNGFWKPPVAVIAGGETIVRLTGKGKGGRNQELALAAAMGMEGLKDTVFFSLGSDGTDGPTDAAGGMVDGGTLSRMRAQGLDPEAVLEDNDAYHGLKASEDLIITGSTGTNVNDVMVLLSRA